MIHVNQDKQSLSNLPKSSLLTLETTLLSSACGGAPLTVFFLKPKNTKTRKIEKSKHNYFEGSNLNAFSNSIMICAFALYWIVLYLSLTLRVVSVINEIIIKIVEVRKHQNIIRVIKSCQVSSATTTACKND